VENLLNMSRLESGVIEPKKDWCDVNELVADVIQRLDEQLKNHIVEIEVRENFPLFKIDYGLMEQVLYNLVHNASQYTPERSLIRISADCADERLLIAVEDNGQGFPEEEKGNVFEKFYRLKHSVAGGTGLGLSIVKGFIEAHNGTVSLENRPLPGGARFVLNIPAEKLLLKQTEK
jgi:two-component system sensor histidine kinase KdpD